MNLFKSYIFLSIQKSNLQFVHFVCKKKMIFLYLSRFVVVPLQGGMHGFYFIVRLVQLEKRGLHK